MTTQTTQEWEEILKDIQDVHWGINCDDVDCEKAYAALNRLEERLKKYVGI